MLSPDVSDAMLLCHAVKITVTRYSVPVELSFPLRSAFVGLPLEQEARWHFQALQAGLSEYEDCLRMQSAATPHLTLQFWPELMEIEYQQALRECTKIAAGREQFSLQVTEAGTFGNRGEDRVLYLDIAFSEPLARLKKACPWPSERRPFSPHITLARVHHPQRFVGVKKRVMKALKDVSFDVLVDRLRLYAEVQGQPQTPLQDFPFQSTR